MNTTAVSSEWVGRVIDGRFTLLQWLGGSGSSGAFLTDSPEDRAQQAVVKLTPVDAAGAEALIPNLERAKSLSHPNLMSVLHSGRFQVNDVDFVYSVTEYAEEVLSQILSERSLTPDEAREMLDPILDALSYLHGKGLAHGHVKPSNIMVVENQVKLSGDCIHVASELCSHPLALVVYDASECATGTISAAADIWSLGVTLVEVLTQHPPFWDRSTNAEPVVAEALPQPFAAIARECLRSDPALRCTLGDIKARLNPDQFLPERASIASAPTSTDSEARTAKFHGAIPVAAVLILIVIIAVLLLRSHHAEPSAPTASEQPAPSSAAPQTQPQDSSSPVAKRGVVKGSVAGQPPPEVLASARESIHGTVNVTIRVTVDPSGKVSSATPDSRGPSKYFARVAEQAAQRWTFKPAQVDGQPASSVWILQFQFRKSGTEITPVEASP